MTYLKLFKSVADGGGAAFSFLMKSKSETKIQFTPALSEINLDGSFLFDFFKMY